MSSTLYTRNSISQKIKSSEYIKFKLNSKLAPPIKVSIKKYIKTSIKINKEI